MKIPKQIKIGAFNIDIKLIPGLVDDGNMSGEQTILINDDLSQKEKELTLLHEVIHAINPAISEREVEWLSRALYQIYNDNI